MWREKSTGTIIREGSSWVDANNIKHPRNWHIWSKTEKEAIGLEELTPDPLPDARTWWYTQDSAGKVTKTAKNLNNVTANGIVTLGVKATLINEVKHQQGGLLAQTDWAIIRKADKGTAIPSNIQTWRDAIRTKAAAMETAITNASDTAALETLYTYTTTDGVTSRPLGELPKL